MAKAKQAEVESVEDKSVEVELNEDGLTPGAAIESSDFLKILAEQRAKANPYEPAKEDDAE